MPELPEVETMRRGITQYILGKTFKDVAVLNGRLRYPITEEALSVLKNETIESIERRAKYLIIKTARYQLLIHLGMTGVLHVLYSGFSPRKHDHVIFKLSDNLALFYNDVRRFGFIQIYDLNETIPFLESLAPEPLDDAFDAAYLTRVLKDRRRMIKPTLMDQSLVVGVGNIYANEVLYLSGIHPKRHSKTLKKADVARLVDNIKLVLQAAIESGGTTLKDFTNPDGNPGYFTQKLKVYDKAGKACEICGSLIVREIINQRASYWCDKCQKL